MKLLELAIQMRKKKPAFIRQDYNNHKRLKKKWVNPRGLHSKVRLKKSGYPRKVQNGYGSPKEVRGLHRSGLLMKIIMNESDLNSVDKSKEGIIIAGNVSLKNKVALLKKAKEKGIAVLNLKVDEYLKNKEEELNKRFEKKKKKQDKKAKKESAKEVITDKLEEKLTDEEKQGQEKKEKDKLLTKREI